MASREGKKKKKESLHYADEIMSQNSQQEEQSKLDFLVGTFRTVESTNLQLCWTVKDRTIKTFR